MDVDMFPSGAAFLCALQNLKPDCVVLDLHMPDLNGFDVQERIAQWGMRLPMIVITGHGTVESRNRAIAGGADLYLLKPVDERVLLDGIVYAISRQDGQSLQAPDQPPGT